MSAISPNYKDEAGNDSSRLRLFGLQVFRANATYTVNVKDPKVTVNGDQAEVKAEVRVNVGGGGIGPLPPRVITLQMKKEPTRRLLIYKVPMWKVTAMVNASPLMEPGL
jgi:hypothetical protein